MLIGEIGMPVQAFLGLHIPVLEMEAIESRDEALIDAMQDERIPVQAQERVVSGVIGRHQVQQHQLANSQHEAVVMIVLGQRQTAHRPGIQVD